MMTYQEFLEQAEKVISYAMAKEHPTYDEEGKKTIRKKGTALAKRSSSSAGGD